MLREVTTWHLELTAPEQLRPAGGLPAGVRLEQVERPSPGLNRFLYTAVGGEYFWTQRLSWTWARWMDWLDRPEVETRVALAGGAPAGYFELESQDGGASVELAYFGVLPEWVGRRLGGPLLEAAVRAAWARGPRRVWVHTCSLDHPRALAAYQARGFRLFDTVRSIEDLPEVAPGPWPGAERPAGWPAAGGKR